TGDKSAAWALGQREGKRGSERIDKGRAWVEKSAEQGLACAQFHVASWYISDVRSRLTPSNAPICMKWLQRAAVQGLEAAEHQLANLLLEGSSGPINVPLAISYLQKAVDQGCPRAEFELAGQYLDGNGEPRTPAESPVSLLRKSASTNY